MNLKYEEPEAMFFLLFLCVLFLSFEPISHAVIPGDPYTYSTEDPYTYSTDGDFACSRRQAEGCSVQAMNLYRCAMGDPDHTTAVESFRQALAVSTEGLTAEAAGSHEFLVDGYSARLVVVQAASHYELALRDADHTTAGESFRRALAVSTVALRKHAAGSHEFLVDDYWAHLVAIQAASHYELAMREDDHATALENFRRALAVSTVALSNHAAGTHPLIPATWADLVAIQAASHYQLAMREDDHTIAVENFRRAVAVSTEVLTVEAAGTHPLIPATWARLVAIYVGSHYQLAMRDANHTTAVENFRQALAVSTIALSNHAAGTHLLTPATWARLVAIQAGSHYELAARDANHATAVENFRQAVAVSTVALSNPAAGSHEFPVDDYWTHLVVVQAASHYELAMRDANHTTAGENFRQAVAVSNVALRKHAAGTHPLIPATWAHLVAIYVGSHYELAMRDANHATAVENFRQALTVSNVALRKHAAGTHPLTPAIWVRLVVIQAGSHYELAMRDADHTTAVESFRQAVAVSTVALSNPAAGTHPLKPTTWVRLVVIQAVSHYELAMRDADHTTAVESFRQAVAVSTVALSNPAAGTHPLKPTTWARLVAIQAVSHYELAMRDANHATAGESFRQALAFSTEVLTAEAAGTHLLTPATLARLITIQVDLLQRIAKGGGVD